MALTAMSQQSLAEIKELQLPTAEDGEITYQFDTATKKPISAKDDRAEVSGLSLSLLPKNPGDQLRLAYSYELKIKDGFVPTSIKVISEDGKSPSTLTEDTKPSLTGNRWSGMSRPGVVDKRAFDAFTSNDPWILQQKFQIKYSDGVERTLHQLAVITSAQRFDMLERLIGKPLVDKKPERQIDSRLWKVGYEAKNASQQLTEFVLPGQTVESWKELFTQQTLTDPEHKLSLEKLVGRIRGGFSPECKSLNWNIVKQGATEIIYQWSHDECKSSPPQFEIARLSLNSRGICRWAYSTKLVPVDVKTQEAYRAIVEKLECE